MKILPSVSGCSNVVLFTFYNMLFMLGGNLRLRSDRVVRNEIAFRAECTLGCSPESDRQTQFEAQSNQANQSTGKLSACWSGGCKHWVVCHLQPPFDSKTTLLLSGFCHGDPVWSWGGALGDSVLLEWRTPNGSRLAVSHCSSLI